jgi:Tfp pilus assembly protein PilF
MEAYSNMAWLYVKQRKNDEAVVLFEKALDLQPANPYLLNNVGWFFADIGKFDEALKYLRKAIAQDPNNPNIHNNIAVAYLKMGDNVKAKSNFEHALQLDSEKTHSAVSYFYLGNIALEEGNPDVALDLFKKAKETDSGYADAYYRIGKILLEKGEIAKGEKSLRDYLKKQNEGEYVAEVKTLLGMDPNAEIEPEKKTEKKDEKKEEKETVSDKTEEVKVPAKPKAAKAAVKAPKTPKAAKVPKDPAAPKKAAKKKKTSDEEKEEEK